MEKSYQIVEPIELQSLFGNPKHFEFAVAVFHWLIQNLYSNFEDQLRDVDIEIINVTYLGSYPALGIHYRSQCPKDMRPFIEASIGQALRNTSVMTLVDAIGKSEISWREITDRVMNQTPSS